MAKREDIVIKFGGDDSRFRKVAKRVQRTGGEIAGTFRRVGVSIGSALGLGAGIAGGGLTASFARMTQQLDEIGKAAEGLNTTVEALAELRYAVSQTSNATDRQFDMVLQRLVKHIGQANRGIKESQKVFTELGLSWEYLSRLDSDKAFLEVADAINRIDDEYKQASVAQKLFEDNWRDLLPTLRTSRKELDALLATARELGTPTTEAARAAAEFNDSLGELSQRVQGLAYRYGPDLLEWLNLFVAKATSETTQLTVLSDIRALGEELDYLEGRTGNFLTKGVLAMRDFADGGERSKERIAELRVELQKLYDELGRQRKKATAQRKDRKNPTDPSGIDPLTGGGKGGAGAAKKPELTYGQANLRDYQAYKSGEIDRDEYLKRENARNPYSNPESPYAGDFSAPSYGSVESQFTVSPKVNQEFVSEVERAVTAAMNGRTYTIKVKPELVGLEGVDVATIDTADKEGSHE